MRADSTSYSESVQPLTVTIFSDPSIHAGEPILQDSKDLVLLYAGEPVLLDAGEAVLLESFVAKVATKHV